MNTEDKINAEVISVYPDRVKISVDDLNSFKIAEEHLKVGSYLRISDKDDVILIAVIDSFCIEVNHTGQRKYLIEASPLGIIKDGQFSRGGDSIAIPPKKVEPASQEEIASIFLSGLKDKRVFDFSRLSRNKRIRVPVDGDKFFNKHIAVVGATGSGKSHTVATILQKAIASKSTGAYEGMNNSHIVLFDMHSEYATAFPSAKVLTVDDLVLPYWLLNSEELEELFLDTGDNNNYNQASVMRMVVTANKKKHNPLADKVFFDSPLKFNMDEVIICLNNLKNETKNTKAIDRYMIMEPGETNKDSSTTPESGTPLTLDEKLELYFSASLEFFPCKNQNVTSGEYADGKLDKFVARFTSKYRQERLNFLFGKHTFNVSLEETIRQFIGYSDSKNSNITIFDLSGIPFEVLSITVSLLARLLFDLCYYYKRFCHATQIKKHEAPILLVLEEAHKYVPRSELARYKSSKNAIERIAKEGRKYGITLLLASQRPSEISETIFSQCSNFIAMRLTNPDDQNYVRKILPDTFGTLTENLSSLQTGEALLMGDAMVLPCLVTIDKTLLGPSSNDIPYLEIWEQPWHKLDFSGLLKHWK